MIQVKGRGRFNIVENFKYVKRHCKVCATTPESCPQKGTFHGELVPLFQPNAFTQFLIKNGLLKPTTPKIPGLMGMWGNEMNISNLVTNAGKAGAASRLNGAGSEAAFTYIAIGTGTTAAAAGDTTLQTEITTNGGQRAAGTTSRVTTDVTNDTARVVVTFNFTGSFAVTEAGLLNAASSGVLLNRQVFTAVNVVSGDSLQVTIDIDVD